MAELADATGLGPVGRKPLEVRVLSPALMPAKTYNAGEALIVPAETVHAVRNVGEGNGAELATYVIEKGKPFIVLAED